MVVGLVIIGSCKTLAFLARNFFLTALISFLSTRRQSSSSSYFFDKHHFSRDFYSLFYSLSDLGISTLFFRPSFSSQQENKTQKKATVYVCISLRSLFIYFFCFFKIWCFEGGDREENLIFFVPNTFVGSFFFSSLLALSTFKAKQVMMTIIIIMLGLFILGVSQLTRFFFPLKNSDYWLYRYFFFLRSRIENEKIKKKYCVFFYAIFFCPKAGQHFPDCSYAFTLNNGSGGGEMREGPPLHEEWRERERERERSSQKTFLIESKTREREKKKKKKHFWQHDTFFSDSNRTKKNFCHSRRARDLFRSAWNMQLPHSHSRE